MKSGGVGAAISRLREDRRGAVRFQRLAALASWRTRAATGRPYGVRGLRAAGCDRRESPEWSRPYGVRGFGRPGIYKVALRAYLRATGDGGPYKARRSKVSFIFHLQSSIFNL